jgi:hypothetical protein
VASGYHLGRRWKITIAAVSGCVVICASLWAWGWYNEQYAWPRKIQIELLGEVIVAHDSLRSFEGSAHWGVGRFRWTHVAPSNPGSAWMKLCPSQVTEDCEFIRHGKPEDQVRTSVSYKDGVVTIEEWWL